MKLADAPDLETVEGAVLTIPPALLRGDARLDALFAPFHECVVLHETLTHAGSEARATRLLLAEVRGDRFDEVRAVVRGVLPKDAAEEKPTELDDVAAGTEWRERGGPLSVSVYRLFGGSTSIQVRLGNAEARDAGMRALRDSPLAILADLVSATSFVEHVSCSRNAREAPRWHLQAALRDLRRFEEIAQLVVALGFEKRAGAYWRERIIVKPKGKDRWMAAVPGIDHHSE